MPKRRPYFVLKYTQPLSEARSTDRYCVEKRWLIRGLNSLGVVVTAWDGQ